MKLSRSLAVLLWPPVQLLHLLALLTLVQLPSDQWHRLPGRMAWLAAAYVCVAIGWRKLRERDADAAPASGEPSARHVLALASLLGIGVWWALTSHGVNVSTKSVPLLEWVLLGGLIAIAALLIAEAMGLNKTETSRRRTAATIAGWTLTVWPLFLTLMRLSAWPTHYAAESKRALLNIVVIGVATLALPVWFALHLRPGTWLRGVALRGLLVALPVVVGLLLVEIAFRATGNFGTNLWEVYDPGNGYVIGQPHSVALWKGRFGTRREFAVETPTNRAGYHDVDHRCEKPAGTLRVAIVGDSFVEATQLPRQESLVALLAGRLNADWPAPVEVMNFGHSGWGQVKEAEVVDVEVMTYSPDLVVVEFFSGNDVRDNSPELTAQMDSQTAPRMQATQVYRFARALKIQSLGFLLHRLEGADPRATKLDWLVYRDPPRDAVWRRAWQATEDALERIRDSCHRAGVPLCVVAFGTADEVAAYRAGADQSLGQSDDVGEPRDFHAPSRFIARWCVAHGVTFLNLPAEFARLPDVAPYGLHFKSDGHWNALAHREAARLLYEHIVRHDLLASRYTPPAPTHSRPTGETARRDATGVPR